jgi:AcrR family transcriptional regulator
MPDATFAKTPQAEDSKAGGSARKKGAQPEHPRSAARPPRDLAPPRKRARDADATRQRILKAAKAEFAKLGLGGARVDTIADRAKANKRMIYHYFTGKDDLFRAVLADAYEDIRSAERRLDLQAMEPEDAIRRLVEFTFDYYLKNPEFLTLVNSENLHKGKHLKTSPDVRAMQQGHVGIVEDILARGVRKGVFRAGVDPVQLAVTIAAIGYYYLTNRFTGSLLFERDFMASEALAARLAFNIETIMRLLRPA